MPDEIDPVLPFEKILSYDCGNWEVYSRDSFCGGGINTNRKIPVNWFSVDMAVFRMLSKISVIGVDVNIIQDRFSFVVIKNCVPLSLTNSGGVVEVFYCFGPSL